jgi:hypothetical protein
VVKRYLCGRGESLVEQRAHDAGSANLGTAHGPVEFAKTWNFLDIAAAICTTPLFTLS